MTVSPKATQRISQERSTFEPIDSDWHEAQVGALVRERIPPRTVIVLDQAARSVRETDPDAGVASPLGAAVRILFGLIWAIDAYFKWQPSFLNGLLDVMHDGRVGQPAWLMPWFDANRAIMATQPAFWAHGVAIAETGIALALIFGVVRKITYIGGAAWSMLIWSTAEGFGRMSSGIATDIGTGIIYAVVFLALLALDYCHGTRRYSLDAVIERHMPWWRHVAEVRR